MPGFKVRFHLKRLHCLKKENNLETPDIVHCPHFTDEETGDQRGKVTLSHTNLSAEGTEKQGLCRWLKPCLNPASAI